MLTLKIYTKYIEKYKNIYVDVIICYSKLLNCLTDLVRKIYSFENRSNER